MHALYMAIYIQIDLKCHYWIFEVIGKDPQNARKAPYKHYDQPIFWIKYDGQMAGLCMGWRGVRGSHFRFIPCENIVLRRKFQTSDNYKYLHRHLPHGANTKLTQRHIEMVYLYYESVRRDLL